MSTISSLPNNGYYQLSNPSGGTGAATTPSLASALSGSSGSASTFGDNAFLLDLSPEAQQYLNGGRAPAASSGDSGSFVLTSQQQQTLTGIIAKYKDAPYTQDTFNQIQNDLSAAGLGADQLSRMDQAKNFNPTQMLIDALNGITTDPQTTTADAQTKSGNYMQQVISQWKNMSTTASASVAPIGAAGGA